MKDYKVTNNYASFPKSQEGTERKLDGDMAKRSRGLEDLHSLRSSMTEDVMRE